MVILKCGAAGVLLAWLAVSLAVSLAQAPGGSSAGRCSVPDTLRIACGDPAIAQSDCEALRCCFDGKACFYGNMVTVQCTGDGQFVVVVSRTATTPPLRLDSLSLLSGPAAPCAAAGISDGFAVFRFPVQACGTQLEGEAGDLVYENLLSAAMDVNEGPNGSITRDSTFKYSGDELVSLDTVILTVAPPPSVVAPGPLSLELRIAREEQYSSYYGDGDYPVTKVLRDPVPVEVRILGRTDPNIVLMLDNCWATSVASPLGQPQWDLLVHGCPYSGDDYVTSVIPVSLSSGLPFPTHYKRFMIRMFTFVNPDTRDPLEESIFIHCSASVCFPSAADRCVASCKRRRRSVTEVRPDAALGETVVSSGLLLLTKDALLLDTLNSANELPAPRKTVSSHAIVLTDSEVQVSEAMSESNLEYEVLLVLPVPESSEFSGLGPVSPALSEGPSTLGMTETPVVPSDQTVIATSSPVVDVQSNGHPVLPSTESPGLQETHPVFSNEADGDSEAPADTELENGGLVVMELNATVSSAAVSTVGSKPGLRKNYKKHGMFGPLGRPRTPVKGVRVSSDAVLTPPALNRGNRKDGRRNPILRRKMSNSNAALTTSPVSAMEDEHTDVSQLISFGLMVLVASVVAVTFIVLLVFLVRSKLRKTR